MIPLTLQARSDAPAPFVTRLSCSQAGGVDVSRLQAEANDTLLFAGDQGLIEIVGQPSAALDGDVVLVDPGAESAHRLLRAGSRHNTLMVTERCDQLCIMCSQPPKKTHQDRFAYFERACLLAAHGETIGLSGGEPTLYKERLLAFLEYVIERRPDLSFHVLTNGQHFEEAEIDRLADRRFRNVVWGIPLYAAEPSLHDQIVAKSGAFLRLERSLRHLIMAGARVELRTVVLQPNWTALDALACHVTTYLRFVEQWSIMQLENIGFARGRWSALYVDPSAEFGPLAQAIDRALLFGVRPALFNFPRCSVPQPYRKFAIASISDWKQKFAPDCCSCAERSDCSGFFEWHPQELLEKVVPI
ncbi:His-Xaa-Ser system radical SAM maturase HxsC [Sphingosinicella sp. CPCC 101087]|uniref:His-Xaa-Ser system radical SAM maturase HxsC n=1 Tax=Sphingosinicella sp. CPCC 101087 TaxID=2497754 RepID=UPI00101DB4F0|nr:His-Xaa-Ser system radical SAM maturase HxsC [Sphingosinicella sp. CPCC 101087]